MAADYDFRRKPNEKGDGEVQPLYPLISSASDQEHREVHRQTG